jgi:TolB-like protein/Flp pilus assembly protein TadD
VVVAAVSAVDSGHRFRVRSRTGAATSAGLNGATSPACRYSLVVLAGVGAFQVGCIKVECCRDERLVKARTVNARKLFGELKRRNVYKVAIAYGVIAWLLIQIATQTFPFFEIPNWMVRAVIVLVLLGLPIALVIAWAFELTPEGLKRTESADELPKKSTRSHAWIYVVVVAGAISVSLFFFARYTASSKQSGLTELPAKSIAVLPFVNLSGNPENAYFTDGIQEEILMRLAKIADLKVVSRTSTVRYKRSPGSLREVAMQLGVANVLEGSVQRTADRVHVNVQLIKAASDAHLWAEAYDRKLTDIFAVESEIAKTIAETLQAKLTGLEQRAIATRPTDNTEAHQLYLKGRYLWNRRTGETLKKALAYFEQAVEKDPHYALAYTGIADSCYLIPGYSAGTPHDYFPRARAAAQKAIELDDTLAEAHNSLASVFFIDFQNAQSVKEYERAISLNPNYATAHEWFGINVLVALGRFDQAIAELKRALELDPVSPIISADLGAAYNLARRYDEAIAQLRDTLEMDPGFYFARWQLGLALELKGATSEAIVEYRKAFELNDDPMVLAVLAHADVGTGKQNEARQILAQLTEEAKTRYVQAYAFPVIHLGLGEKDQALDWLQKAARDHDGFYSPLMNVDPYLDPLRGDPRFEALVSAILSGSIK